MSCHSNVGFQPRLCRVFLHKNKDIQVLTSHRWPGYVGHLQPLWKFLVSHFIVTSFQIPVRTILRFMSSPVGGHPVEENNQFRRHKFLRSYIKRFGQVEDYFLITFIYTNIIVHISASSNAYGSVRGTGF